MKKLIYSVLIFSILIGVTGCKKSKIAVNTQDKSIVVFYDNDVHCNIDGYVTFAGARDAVARMDSAYVLTVSSGDFAQGGTAGVLSKGEYPVCLMNSVGYDAVTIGNHEFDYKTPRLLELTKILKTPVTCVNFTEMGKTEPVFKPYVMKMCGKKRVAFVGVLTPEAQTAEYYAFFDDNNKQIYDIHKDDVCTMTQQAVDNARRDGADYVVLLAHIGVEYADLNTTQLIAATNGVDAVLDGHSHSVINQEFAPNKDGKQVLYTQTGTQFANIGKLLISKDGGFSSTLLPAKDITEKSAKVQATLDSVKTLYNEVASQIIGRSEVLLTINGEDGQRAVRKAETNAGDFVADAYRYAGEAEIGITNGGGVRTDIKPGDVTMQNILDISPFCNALDVISCKGSGIVALLKNTYSLIPEENGSFAQVSGMKCEVTLSSGGNEVSNVEVLDKATGKYIPMDMNKEYIVCATDYVIKLLEKEIGEYKIIKKEFTTDNESIVTFLRDGLKGVIGQEYAKSQGRIIIK